MNEPSPVLTLRVSAIRSQNPHGRGGAIFTGIEIDAQGWRTDAITHYVVKASGTLLQATVERGQLWRVTGKPADNTVLVNGYRLTEATIIPDALELLRPSGEHIITLLSEGDAFVGIGYVKAQRLWEHFGQDLYEILDRRDVKRLIEVLSLPMAEKLAEAWSRWGDTFTLQWLQAKGFEVSLGRKVLDYFGRNTSSKIEEDPYRLISFAANWKTVDDLAQGTFAIPPDDPRRLAGAIDEALYAAFDVGDMCLYRNDLKRRLRELLTGLNEEAIEEAIRAGERRGSFIMRNDRFHALGLYLMESTVVETIVPRLKNSEPLICRTELTAFIAAYEAEARTTLSDATFHLNDKQREALLVCNTNSIAVITGGAGTGKTTVLRALFRLCEAAGHAIYPMALSGRAAKRIGEATGHKAQTIAGFLKHFPLEDAPDRAVVVIDEASMVDLPSVYRVMRQLPSGYRIVLVGDPHQLPPVGPGLLLHELVHEQTIPLVELTEVRRYGGSIAKAAAAIRAGRWPDLTGNPGTDIVFLPCAPAQINATVLDVYNEDRSASQILCAIRNSVAGGAKPINTLCQHSLNAQGEELMLWNAEYDQRQTTGFRVGDPVICIKNDWEIDLQNGSLGVILSVASQTPKDDPKRCLGQIQCDDGQVRNLTIDLLPYLELAYAITIHKSQGSAFRRVIVPITRSKLLDRTLLYTAVTRAERQVILVGDMGAARGAVLAPRRSDERHVALRSLLRERLAALSLVKD